MFSYWALISPDEIYHVTCLADVQSGLHEQRRPCAILSHAKIKRRHHLASTPPQQLP
jgi:hypothetical protein